MIRRSLINIKQDSHNLKQRVEKLEKIYDYYSEERPITKKTYSPTE